MGTLLFICNVLNTIWYFQSSWISNKLYTRIVAMHLKTSTLGPDVAVFAFFRSFAKKQLQTSFSFVFEFSAPNDVTITSCCNVANNYNAYWFLFDGIEWRFLPHIFHTKNRKLQFLQQNTVSFQNILSCHNFDCSAIFFFELFIDDAHMPRETEKAAKQLLTHLLNLQLLHKSIGIVTSSNHQQKYQELACTQRGRDLLCFFFLAQFIIQNITIKLHKRNWKCICFLRRVLMATKSKNM